LEEGDEALVLELGVSAPGEMAPLANAVEPTVVVITGVTPTHLEFFGGVAAVRREKATLLDYTRPGGAAVLNADDALVASLAYELPDGVRCVTYGLTPAADVHAAGPATLALAGSRFTLAGGREVTLQVPGVYNVSNALAAVAVARLLGVSDEDAAPALASYSGRPLRSNVVATADGVTFFADCYNASPYAVEAALAFIAGVPVAGRRVAVLGDMLELGAASDAAHRAAGKFAAEKGYDVLVGLGPGGAAMVAGAVAAGMPPARARGFESYDAAAAFLRDTLAAGDVVVVKASRAMKLEELLARLGVAGGA
jgi:UDP-N-acetylmuramyl pentapeptide synthase